MEQGKESLAEHSPFCLTTLCTPRTHHVLFVRIGQFRFTLLLSDSFGSLFSSPLGAVLALLADSNAVRVWVKLVVSDYKPIH